MNQEKSLCKEAKWENENFNANKYLCQSAFQRPLCFNGSLVSRNPGLFKLRKGSHYLKVI